MYNRARILSLEQRRQKQLLSLMFIHENRHNVARIYARETRAAQVFSFVSERYHCIKYKNSPYYKGALLWDGLPLEAKNCTDIIEFKKCMSKLYREYIHSIK